MAEIEGEHRRGLEKIMVQSDVDSASTIPKEVRLGQIFAFFLALSFLVAGGS